MIYSLTRSRCYAFHIVKLGHSETLIRLNAAEVFWILEARTAARLALSILHEMPRGTAILDRVPPDHENWQTVKELFGPYFPLSVKF